MGGGGDMKNYVLVRAISNLPPTQSFPEQDVAMTEKIYIVLLRMVW